MKIYSILITRPYPEGKVLTNLLKQEGFKTFYMPLIDIVSGKDLFFLPYELNKLKNGDYIFFLSKNSIKFIKKKIKNSINWPSYVNYYAIGINTASLAYNISGHLINFPIEENSENLIKLINFKNIVGKTALILKGDGGRNILPKYLIKNGVKVIFCECYKKINKKYNKHIKKKILNSNIDTILVTSCFILYRLYYSFSKYYRNQWLIKCNLLVVSKRISSLAYQLGWKKIIITNKADNNSIIQILSRY